ncbi:MAG: hypothetical protein M1832_001975 [Thelocarpon impressellum]|nr:MAG: hypothetical protein M1832_001975 [Thelocarpon impressellum]
MAGIYDPAPSAVPKPPWNTARLSQRDLSVQIPINFVTQPGVSLAAACFGHRRYRDDDAASCISDLLAVGYRRFVVDLYWDGEREEWNLCPVAVPLSETPISIPSSSASSTSSTPSAAAATDDGGTITAASSLASGFVARQATGPSSSSSSSRSTSATSSAVPFISANPSTLNETLYQIGPYMCTASVDVSLFLDVIQDFLKQSEDTLNAHLLIVILNVHAAAATPSPEGPAPVPADLPEPSLSLGTVLKSRLSPFLYTPAELREERADLNSSWYTVSRTYQPDPAYFTTQTAPDDRHFTTDGWPSEGYVEFSRGKRLLVGWGSVAPQMREYNFTGDEATIFPADSLQDFRDVSTSREGDIDGGCFFDRNKKTVESANSSWAVSTETTIPNGMFEPSLNVTANLTDCGISPQLSQTLLNATATDSLAPYAAVVAGTLWSWAAGEPRNSSIGVPASSPSAASSTFRCALMDASLSGRWRVDDCTRHHRAACRVGKQPYEWVLSEPSTPYGLSAPSCPRNSTFSVPRTALENRHLYAALAPSPSPSRAREAEPVTAWLDLNALDVEACWVAAAGPTATCPYFESAAGAYRRNVLVPTVAGTIVLVLTGLTLFVKCRSNRRGQRRRRLRAEAVGAGEGVPS